MSQDPTLDLPPDPPGGDPASFPPAAAAATPAALSALARADMDRRWAAGRRIPAEWYLDRSPTLAGCAESSLDVVYMEFVLRQEAGEGPTAGQYAARFPRLAADLERLLSLHTALSGSTAPGPPAVGGPFPRYVGRYLVTESLGRGGQADVYLGLHPTLGREVVVKVLRPRARGASGVSEGERARLVTEGRALADLDHPNIARVYDLDDAGGRPFLVTESVRGRNLDQVRRHGPVAAADAARWVAAAARAAGYAHGRGVLHLDIKPANVVLGEAGRAVLIDFGLARIDRGLAGAADSGVSGTLAYMAPEQARGDDARVGPPADVYALGGVLYYLLVGKPPRAAATLADVTDPAGGWDRAALRAVRPPARLRRAVERALNPDPSRRFPNGAALAAALHRNPTPKRWRAVAAVALAGAVVAAAVGTWGGRPAAVAPAVALAVEAAPPPLGLTLRVYRGGRFHDDYPTPFRVGEQAQVRAVVPAGHHASLFLLTEAGEAQLLAVAAPDPADSPLAFPRDGVAPAGRASTFQFTRPGGTHVLLVAASASGPPSAHLLGLESGVRWARLPDESVLRCRGGRVEVVSRARGVGAGDSVADPEGGVTARLSALVAAAPGGVSVEWIAFAVAQP